MIDNVQSVFGTVANGMMFAMNEGGGGSGWSINSFLKNLNDSMLSWGRIIVVIIGVVMVIAGIFQIAKGLMSGGRSQTNWVTSLALLFIGGGLAFTGGWGLVQSVASGGATTLNELGAGTTATSIVQDAGALSNVINVGGFNISID